MRGIVLTSPLGDETVNVHEEGEELVRLREPRFVSVERYHDGALQRFVGQPAIHSINEHTRIVLSNSCEVNHNVLLM